MSLFRFNRKDNLLRHKKTHVANSAIENENGNNRKRHNMLYGVSLDTVHLISTIKNAVENTTNANNFVEDFAMAIDGAELFSSDKRRQTLKPVKTRRKQKMNISSEILNSSFTTTKCQIDEENFIDPVAIDDEDPVKSIANLFSEIKSDGKTTESTDL